MDWASCTLKSFTTWRRRFELVIISASLIVMYTFLQPVLRERNIQTVRAPQYMVFGGAAFLVLAISLEKHEQLAVVPLSVWLRLLPLILNGLCLINFFSLTREEASVLCETFTSAPVTFVRVVITSLVGSVWASCPLQKPLLDCIMVSLFILTCTVIAVWALQGATDEVGLATRLTALASCIAPFLSCYSFTYATEVWMMQPIYQRLNRQCEKETEKTKECIIRRMAKDGAAKLPLTLASLSQRGLKL